MQLNLLTAYDINKNIPLVTRVYPGSILDKTSVKDLLEFHKYHDILFLIDRGFYSEENIKLLSQNNNKYIIPLSQNLKKYKEITKDMNLREIFIYEKGKKSVSIEYIEEIIDENKKVIIYKDLVQNAKERTDYIKNMEKEPKKYTKENFEKIKDFFGTIVLQSNLNEDAKKIYEYYKKRWKIETFFNYLKNKVDITALGLSDYYTIQGMSFIVIIIGMIYRNLEEVTKNINEKNLNDCFLETRFLKINKKGKKWQISNAKKYLQELLKKFNVDLIKLL